MPCAPLSVAAYAESVPDTAYGARRPVPVVRRSYRPKPLLPRLGQPRASTGQGTARAQAERHRVPYL
eukprot:848934-Rhodomonas_salina.1